MRIAPPERIPAGSVGRCWLRDPKPTPFGSEGWVDYSYVVNGQLRTVRFWFTDPTGWSQNAVSVSTNAFGFYTKSTNVNNPWSQLNQQTPWGHPLFVSFTWAGLQP